MTCGHFVVNAGMTVVRRIVVEFTVSEYCIHERVSYDAIALSFKEDFHDRAVGSWRPRMAGHSLESGMQGTG